MDACKDAGLPEPEYGTDGLFVWIIFKRPNLVTGSDTLILSAKQKEVLMFCIIERSCREILEHINVTFQTKNRAMFINVLIAM